jgi:hypothetical protein
VLVLGRAVWAVCETLHRESFVGIFFVEAEEERISCPIFIKPTLADVISV